MAGEVSSSLEFNRQQGNETKKMKLTAEVSKQLIAEQEKVTTNLVSAVEAGTKIEGKVNANTADKAKTEAEKSKLTDEEKKVKQAIDVADHQIKAVEAQTAKLTAEQKRVTDRKTVLVGSLKSCDDILAKSDPAPEKGTDSSVAPSKGPGTTYEKQSVYVEKLKISEELRELAMQENTFNSALEDLKKQRIDLSTRLKGFRENSALNQAEMTKLIVELKRAQVALENSKRALVIAQKSQERITKRVETIKHATSKLPNYNDVVAGKYENTQVDPDQDVRTVLVGLHNDMVKIDNEYKTDKTNSLMYDARNKPSDVDLDAADTTTENIALNNYELTRALNSAGGLQDIDPNTVFGKGVRSVFGPTGNGDFFQNGLGMDYNTTVDSSNRTAIDAKDTDAITKVIESYETAPAAPVPPEQKSSGAGGKGLPDAPKASNIDYNVSHSSMTSDEVNDALKDTKNVAYVRVRDKWMTLRQTSAGSFDLYDGARLRQTNVDVARVDEVYIHDASKDIPFDPDVRNSLPERTKITTDQMEQSGWNFGGTSTPENIWKKFEQRAILNGEYDKLKELFPSGEANYAPKDLKENLPLTFAAFFDVQPKQQRQAQDQSGTVTAGVEG